MGASWLRSMRALLQALSGAIPWEYWGAATRGSRRAVPISSRMPGPGDIAVGPRQVPLSRSGPWARASPSVGSAACELPAATRPGWCLAAPAPSGRAAREGLPGFSQTHHCEEAMLLLSMGPSAQRPWSAVGRTSPGFP